ncbi:MAG TPA: hypothetical protein PLU22_18505 [Polyangiaceae bacterium]|nr:hypothetical protein [Polyangiaceae bacterium]
MTAAPSRGTGVAVRAVAAHLALAHLALAHLALLHLGCATTVTRLEGEIPTPAGAAQGPCEEERWLSLSPTRYEAMSDSGTSSEYREDGLGLYREGDRHPRSITALEEDLGPSPLLPPHRDATRAYDRDRVIAGSLGLLGIAAMGLGAGLFATSFETETTGVPPAVEEEQVVDTGRAVTGAVLMAAGFGVAIGGIALNPTHAERARAQTARYVFLPGQEDREAVVRLVADHNDELRTTCAREDGAGSAKKGDDGEANDTDAGPEPGDDAAPPAGATDGP